MKRMKALMSSHCSVYQSTFVLIDSIAVMDPDVTGFHGFERYFVTEVY